jgi:hypothetical protein
MRYFLRFRHSDTGLAPTFVFFKKSADLSNVTPPAIGEVGTGTYFFDYAPTFDIIFEVDGGASIPTEEVRYIADSISPKDGYVDEPVSQVKTDVWGDNTVWAGGTKGNEVDLIPSIKTSTDQIAAIKAKTDNLPADPAGQAATGTAITAAKVSIKGAQDLSISTIAGAAAFVPGTDDLHSISGHVSTFSPADNAGIAAIKAKTDNLPVDTNAVLTGIAGQMTRALGMLHENSVLDQTSFDTNNNMTAARLRLYDSKAHAQAAGATGLIAQYAIVATYTGSILNNYTVTRES